MPANGEVTGPGLLGLFGGFVYSGDGDLPDSFQTYILDGLVAGESYELRIYVRVWAKAASGRPVTLTFENGAQSVATYFLEDRPGIMLGNGNPDSAYALVFPYTAEGTSLTFTAAVPLTTTIPSGSFHLYGLTNEAVAAANDGSFVITGLVFQQTPVPSATLTFTSEPGAVYAIEYSTALTAAGQPGGWITLASNVSSQGTQTIYTDTTAAGTAPRLFYRARRVTPP